MRLAALLLTRVLAFVEVADLNPHEAAFYPSIVAGLVKKCGFMKFPQKLEELDEEKGIDFIGGQWNGATVDKLTIYRNGFLLDTRASTNESKRILLEALEWGRSEFGLVYDPKMITRWGYLTNLTFYSECEKLLSGSNPIANMSQRIYAEVSKISQDKTLWDTSVLTFHSETVPRPPNSAGFSIQRRGEARFSENKYWSESPLPSDVHFALLEQFEADVIASLK